MLWTDAKKIAHEEIAARYGPVPIDTDIACHILTRSAGLPALKGFVVSLTPKLVPAFPSSTVIGGSESLLRGFGIAFSGFQSQMIVKYSLFL